MSTLFKKVYLHLFVFITIYIEFGYHMQVTNQVPGWIRMAVLLASSLPLLFFSIKKTIKAAPVLWFIYFTVLILANAFRGEALKNCLLLLVPLSVGFIAATTVDLRELIKAFNNVVLFLAAFSLVTFIISLTVPSLIDALPSLPTPFTTDARIHNAFFSVCIRNSVNLRNYGITWEPGAFAVLLAVSLYCQLILNEKPNFKKIVLLIATMITTFSTMGYFVMAAILFISLFQRQQFTKKRFMGGLLLCATVVVVFFFLPTEWRQLVFMKLEGLFNEDTSLSVTTQARLDAVIYPFRAFISSPVFGVGYDAFSIINETLCNSAATNTILNWFAVMGILLGAPCLFYYFKFILLSADHVRLSKVSLIVLLAAAVLLVSTESLLRISLIYVIIFCGMNSDCFEKKGAQIAQA